MAQFLNSVYVDYCRTMNARELCRIKVRFHAADGVSLQVRIFADVKPHIISFGFYPINLFFLKKITRPLVLIMSRSTKSCFFLICRSNASSLSLKSLSRLICDFAQQCVSESLPIERL